VPKRLFGSIEPRLQRLSTMGVSGHEDGWFHVGLASSFPNTTTSGTSTLSDKQSCNEGNQENRGCKVFHAPSAGGGSPEAVELSSDPKDQAVASLRMGEQVLVFQYQNRFHAISNVGSGQSFAATTDNGRNVLIRRTRCPMVYLSISKSLVSC
jgi:hypothetical protein